MKKISGKRMNGRTKSIIALTIAAVLSIFFGIVGVTGMNLTPNGLYKLKSWLPTTNADNWPDSLALGLDLRGGVYVEYSCAAPEGSEADFGTLLSGTIRVIQERLTDKGYAEATVQQIGTDGIRVEIPDVTDPAAVLDLIGSPAKLEFLDSDGNVFMDGSALQTAITTGSGVITQMQSAEYAQTVAAQIQSGALPMELTQQKVDTVSATLGTDALSTSVLAAVIGLVLIMALMIFRYRLNGVVASWALCDYVIILFFLLAVIPGIQLTLPGLAGIVLGIGMAVDANVIIFERFNEELRAGRGIRTALRTGFKNAMSAILDANVTTLIAAIVLMFFGTGSIQGFAKTLLLGVVVSMLSAVVITRFLMKNIINLGVKDKRMFAKLPVAEEEQK